MQFQVGTQESRTQLCNEFLSSIALVSPALAAKVSVKALLVLRPMRQFVRQRRIVAFGVLKCLERRHLHVIRLLRVIGTVPAVADVGLGVGKEPVGRLDAGYCFIHVDDCVRAIDAAINADVSGDTLFVGHPQAASAREVLEAIQAGVGSGTIVRFPTSVLWMAAIGGDMAGAITGRAPLINRRRYAELMAGGFSCRVDRLRERLGVVASIGLR